MNCGKKQRDELNKQNSCDKHCPLECDSTVYSTSVSSAKYPTTYYWDVIKYQQNLITMSTSKNKFVPGENPTQSPNQTSALLPPPPPPFVDSNLSESILMLSIYFDELRYSLIEEEPAIDFLTLLGVIGIRF